MSFNNTIHGFNLSGMRKNSLLAFVMMISVCSFGQLGISAGLNISKYAYSEKTFDIDRKAVMAYNFGVQYKISISETVYLLPELGYTVKGANVYFSYPIGYTGPMKYTNRFNYLQLIVPAIAALPINDELDYEIGAGVFAGYMLNGRSKIEEFDGSTSERKFVSGDLKRMDYGLHLATGFRLGKKLGFHLKYDLGLANIEPNSSNPTVRTRNLSVNFSWLFTEAD